MIYTYTVCTAGNRKGSGGSVITSTSYEYSALQMVVPVTVEDAFESSTPDAGIIHYIV